MRARPWWWLMLVVCVWVWACAAKPPQDFQPMDPVLVIGSGGPVVRQPQVELHLDAAHMVAGRGGHQMRVTASGGVDTGWIAYQKTHDLDLALQGRNEVKVFFRNHAGTGGAAGYVDYLPNSTQKENSQVKKKSDCQ